jgi:hypothetical protein
MQLSGFDRFAWAASFTGQILILAVLLLRRRARNFPIFTLYILEGIVTTVVGFFVFYHLPFSTYQHVYWSSGLLDEALQLLVVYEIAVHIFCPTGVWARDVRKTFISLAGASVVIALLLTWLAHPVAPKWIQTFILRSDFFSAALMSELFVGMVILSATVGLPWKTHVARIAQGLGTYSLICVGLDIIANLVGLNRGRHTFTQLDHLKSLTWIACELYWVVMLWVEAPAPRELPEAMRNQIYTLQRQVENDLVRIRAWRKH